MARELTSRHDTADSPAVLFRWLLSQINRPSTGHTLEEKLHAHFPGNSSAIYSRVFHRLRTCPNLAYSQINDTYYPADWLLKDCQFYIDNLSLVTARALLIPGHNFDPFHDYSRFGWPAVSFEGHILPYTWHHMSLSDLQGHYCLLPARRLLKQFKPYRLAADSYRIPVLDLSTLAERLKHSFMKMIPDSTTPGLYKLELVEKSHLLKEKKQLFSLDTRLCEAMLEVLSPELPQDPLRVMLDAYADLYAEDPAVYHTTCHSPLVRVIRQSSIIDLIDFDLLGMPVLVPEKSDPEVFYRNFHRNLVIDEAGEDSMDGLYRLAGLSLNSVITRAIILDCLSSGLERPRDILEILFEGLTTIHWTTEQKDNYNEFFLEMYRECSSLIDGESSGGPLIALRAKIVALMRRHLAFLRVIDHRLHIPYSQLPENEMSRLIEIDAILVESLAVLESRQPFPPSFLANVSQMMDSLQADWEKHTRAIKLSLKMVF